jgi:hypothetical protein
MHPEAVEGLPEKGILAVSGFSSETPAAVGASEQARRQGHRVHEREGRVVRGEREKLLPEALLNLPEFGRLPGEGGSMYLAKGGKPSMVMSAEEEVYVLIGVDGQELSHDLKGEDLSVRKLRSGTAPSDAAPLELVIDEAEDSDDEGAKIHQRPPYTR